MSEPDEFYSMKMLPKIAPNFQMSCNGRFATLKIAPKLKDIGRPHQLPPGASVPVYPVDMFPGAPESWVRGLGSYVCPVFADCGIWFDWTDNNTLNTAILASVKGMNPITGQKLEGLHLEKYVEKCPIHNELFKGELFCSKCNYKWPPQSYICYPNVLWWDGFRQTDGTVRQFFFSEDELRDVASAVIGKQNTVPAFGFAFYDAVNPRVSTQGGSRCMSFGGGWHMPGVYINNVPGPDTEVVYGSAMNFCDSGHADNKLDSHAVYTCSLDHLSQETEEKTCAMPSKKYVQVCKGPKEKQEYSCLRSAPIKEVSIGAGAEIDQNLLCDPLNLDAWKKEPTAVIRLYFTFKDQFEQIISKGVNDLTGSKEGFLKGVKVGD
jgi:hypothetical protein